VPKDRQNEPKTACKPLKQTFINLAWYNESMNNDLNVLLDKFLIYLELEHNCSSLTIRNYRHYLLSIFDFLSDNGKKQINLKDITVENIQNFRLSLKSKDFKMVTQGYYIISLRSFLKWLRRIDVKALDPEKLDVPKGKDHSLKFLDESQMHRLLNQPLLSSKTGPRDKAILELLFSTGLRVSELVGLNRDQINLKTREFGVIGKGGRNRLVFISMEATKYLDQYLVTRCDNEKALFVNNKLGRLTSRSIQRLVKNYVAKAKLPVAATPHTLRHSMATDLLRSGADIRSVQEILGHKNIATTQIYTHVTDARLREIHDKFHSGNKG